MSTVQSRSETAPARREGNAGLHEDSPQFLRLTVGAKGFAAPLDAVREILQVGAMTPLPMTPRFVRGVMNLRGAVVPVLDLSARFGMAVASLTPRSCIVIVDAPADEAGERAGQAIGLLVDAVLEVVDVPEADIEPVPSLGTSVSAEFLAGVARFRGMLYPILALPRILDTAVLAGMIAGFDAVN